MIKSDSDHADSAALRFAWRGLTALRWYFGVGWAAFGFGGIVGSLIVLSHGDGGESFLLFGGGALMVALAWQVHPWGLQRGKRRVRSDPSSDKTNT